MSELIKPCPWCKSSKVMCEGDGTRVYAVCQKCLAHGPEVHVGEMTTDQFRSAVIKEWNTRNRGKFSKINCPSCNSLVAITGNGIWSHRVFRDGQYRQCPSSGKLL